jgi:hypothetical protein
LLSAFFDAPAAAFFVAIETSVNGGTPGPTSN